MSATLAKPCGECCFHDRSGGKIQHSGTPRGKFETIAGVPTYVARPLHADEGGRAPRKVLLFFADVFGPLYVPSQRAMDYWADHGAPPLPPLPHSPTPPSTRAQDGG